MYVFTYFGYILGVDAGFHGKFMFNILRNYQTILQDIFLCHFTFPSPKLIEISINFSSSSPTLVIVFFILAILMGAK